MGTPPSLQGQETGDHLTSYMQPIRVKGTFSGCKKEVLRHQRRRKISGGIQPRPMTLSQRSNQPRAMTVITSIRLLLKNADANFYPWRSASRCASCNGDRCNYNYFENFKFISVRLRKVVSAPWRASRGQQRCLPHVWFWFGGLSKLDSKS